MGAEKFETPMPFWPEAMGRGMALAYTGVAEAQLKAWEKTRKVVFRPRGPNGAMIALRADLAAALADLLSGNDTGEDLDFGDD